MRTSSLRPHEAVLYKILVLKNKQIRIKFLDQMPVFFVRIRDSVMNDFANILIFEKIIFFRYFILNKQKLFHLMFSLGLSLFSQLRY